jgi:hypothetical protein
VIQYVVVRNDWEEGYGPFTSYTLARNVCSDLEEFANPGFSYEVVELLPVREALALVREGKERF